MYLISPESCDVDLSNSIHYMFIDFLEPKIHCDQYKTTKHLNGFVPHCIAEQ